MPIKREKQYYSNCEKIIINRIIIVRLSSLGNTNPWSRLRTSRGIKYAKQESRNYTGAINEQGYEVPTVLHSTKLYCHYVSISVS